MTNSLLRGLGTALVTPFTPDGQVDFAALGELIEKQIKAEVDYLVVLGTTAESATLTHDEKKAICEFVIQKNNNRLPLVLGMGGNCTAEVVALLQANHDLIAQHFAAILSVCPYYNRPSQEGLFRHFSAIAQASPIPVILYNIPARTGVNILPETVVRIWHTNPGRFLGIKEASHDLDQIQQLISLTQDGLGLFSLVQQPFLVISGDDSLAVDILRLGGHGLISVAANAYPEVMRRIVHERDAELLEQYRNMIRLMFKEGNPGGIKTVLHLMGLVHNRLRLPLVENSPELIAEIQQEMTNLPSVQ